MGHGCTPLSLWAASLLHYCHVYAYHYHFNQVPMTSVVIPTGSIMGRFTIYTAATCANNPSGTTDSQNPEYPSTPLYATACLRSLTHPTQGP